MIRLLLALLVLAVGVAGAQQPERPFSTRTELVVVPVVVVDERGQTVSGLTADDFEVREDGNRVALSTFVAAGERGRDASGGRFIVLLLDDFRAEFAWRIKDLAGQFAQRMGPGDVVTVIRLDGDRSVTSSDARVVRAAIQRFRPGPPPLLGPRVQSEHTLKTISELVGQMAAAPHPRKVLVWIGAAGIFGPHSDGMSIPDYGQAWFDALRDTARGNVSVYAIDPAGGRNVRTGMRGSLDNADGFAAETGGEAFLRSNDFERAVRRIWHESGSYYLLGYAPAVADDRTHEIDVRVKRPNVTVRARRAR